MRHPQYCLTHNPGISFNITNATHFSMPPTPTRKRTFHFTNVGAPPMPPTLARHPGQQAVNAKHTTHVSTHPTQARHPRHSPQHKQNAISQIPGYPIKLLKLLGLKFQEEIQQFLFLLFIFIAFTLKLNLFRGDQSALFKRRPFFQKQMRNIFRKNCFLILVLF